MTQKDFVLNKNRFDVEIITQIHVIGSIAAF